MNLLRLWEDLNAWNKIGLCAVVAAVVILVLLYVF